MHRYVVEQAEMITPTTLLLTLGAAEEGKFFMFEPGQYAALSFRHRGRPTAARCFSIASSPTEQNKLQFGIRVAGKYTHALSAIKPGSEVRVRGPYGGFIFDAPRQQEVVLCAGGIGITPCLSMMRFATATQLPNKLTLIYSIRSQEDAAFTDELAALAHNNPNITLLFAVSAGNTDRLPGKRHFPGRINPDILREASANDANGKTYFICGPALFMQSTVTMLQDMGASPSSIITEAFSQGHGRQTSKARGWPFNIYLLGATSTAAASITLMANDLIKSIPPSLLPETLSSESMPNRGNSRQTELDQIINDLLPRVSTTSESPSIAAAQKEVREAEAKAAEINAQNAANTGTTYVAAPTKKTATSNTTSTTSTSTGATTTQTPVSTPKPTPTPVCTTSASGVTTCV